MSSADQRMPGVAGRPSRPQRAGARGVEMTECVVPGGVAYARMVGAGWGGSGAQPGGRCAGLLPVTVLDVMEKTFRTYVVLGTGTSDTQ